MTTDRARLLLLVTLCCAALLGGCLRRTPATSYYSLYDPTARPAPAAAPAPPGLVVSVGPVVLPDLLRQAQIATGGAGGRYRLAEYHRWSGELDRDFARALAEQLTAVLGTERVALFPWDQHLAPTRRVMVDVLAMDGEPGGEARLSVRWAVRSGAGEEPLLVRRSELRTPLSEAGYPAWVRGQQGNIARLAAEIAAAL